MAGLLSTDRQDGTAQPVASGLVGCGVPVFFAKRKRSVWDFPWASLAFGDGSKPISIIFSGMNIHLLAIFMFTRGTRFRDTAIYPIWKTQFGDDFDLHWSALS